MKKFALAALAAVILTSAASANEAYRAAPPVVQLAIARDYCTHFNKPGQPAFDHLDKRNRAIYENIETPLRLVDDEERAANQTENQIGLDLEPRRQAFCQGISR
jgi:hypothetical protein